MRFYSLPKLLKITSTNPIKTFLENPWKYKNLSEAYFSFCNVTWDGTRNHLAFDLGYPTEGADDMEAAERYIKELEYDFKLVLLLEHLDESLVLLRRLMCWEMKDVVYDTAPKNVVNYSYESYNATPEELANLRRWKAVDYRLYDTFNRSLWRKIAGQGPDFYRELHHYRELKQNISWFCHGEQRRKPKLTLTVKTSQWSPQFVVDARYCKEMATRSWDMMKEIRQKESFKVDTRWEIVLPVINVRSIINGRPTFKYRIEQIKYVKELRRKIPKHKTFRKRRNHG
ncbi:PREDICTED: galactose-3-O-sulfotransferase 3-like [Branchiostoma belcheri]|uniref:Galactose-3-O-sulfotransferase 3-like n=1 Tax=Branchiostoma belcheri TaxID=7741 RepID=A0A6P4ZC04_BRABE|nr:PREDICTED: galactose-3-O-sulfotransferase 3-like [Branchiostoma belcheri]